MCSGKGEGALRVLLLGFGNVGRQFCEMLSVKANFLRASYGLEMCIVGVATRHRGSICASSGLPVERLLKTEEETGRVGVWEQPYIVGQSVDELLENCDYDVLVECTSPNMETGEPAADYIRKALKGKHHVVTSNKGPLLFYFHELTEIAAMHGVYFLYEGTVMAGTPLFSLARCGLAGSRIRRFEGIVNSTTNYMLTLIAAGSSFDEALRDAQRRGYAEADPTLDVDGWDAAAKVIIVAQAILGMPAVDFRSVAVEGIRGITPYMMDDARRRGGCIKLIARASLDEEPSISVKPEVIPFSHPLASVEGITNGALLLSDTIGEISIIGPGAGARETASAILRDLIAIETGGRLLER